jgi:hypothetical protein
VNVSTFDSHNRPNRIGASRRTRSAENGAADGNNTECSDRHLTMEFSRGGEERSAEPDVGCNDSLGRIRATAATNRRLVQELPGFGAIESPNPRCLNHRRIKVAEVYPHTGSTPLDWLPVRYAATHCASTQRQAFVTPDVSVDGSLASGDLHLARFVVAPQPGVTATD